MLEYDELFILLAMDIKLKKLFEQKLNSLDYDSLGIFSISKEQKVPDLNKYNNGAD